MFKSLNRRNLFKLSAVGAGTMLLSACKTGESSLNKEDIRIGDRYYTVSKDFASMETKEYLICPEGLCDYTPFKHDINRMVTSYIHNVYLKRWEEVINKLSGTYDRSKPIYATLYKGHTLGSLMSTYFDAISGGELVYNKKGTAFKDLIEVSGLLLYTHERNGDYTYAGYIDADPTVPFTTPGMEGFSSLDGILPKLTPEDFNDKDSLIKKFAKGM